MKYYSGNFEGNTFSIEGIPDVVKAIAIEGNKAKRLSDLSLHRSDLAFADSCLDSINSISEEKDTIREALWRSAIVHYMKCFGSSARFRLSAKKIYRDEPDEAIENFKYFKELRNRHVVHDENAYAQSKPGALLSDGSKDKKIVDVICFQALSTTLRQEEFSNLKLLVDRAAKWVETEFGELVDSIAEDLEECSYHDLVNRDPLKYSVPTLEEVSVPREKR